MAQSLAKGISASESAYNIRIAAMKYPHIQYLDTSRNIYDRSAFEILSAEQHDV